jgi:peptidoglycan/xylan/chitin deacetylase (PgdA/CDA1 family)
MLRALLYHRIQETDTSDSALAPDLISASPALFERQMRYIARAYHPVGPAEILAAVAGGHTLPARAVVVTFDDGYRDFLEMAWPILSKYRIPCVLFVATAFVDHPQQIFWWDAVWQQVSRTRRDRVVVADRTLSIASAGHAAAYRAITVALKQQTPVQRRSGLAALAAQLGVEPEPTHAVLSWPELRQLRDSGLTVAPHSRSHELLDQLHPGELRAEIDGSRDDLRRELGMCPPVFAYPNGNFNELAMRALERADFKAALTTVRGVSVLGRTHPLALRREDARTSLVRLALKLTEPVAAIRNRQRPLPAYAELPRPAPQGKSSSVGT